MIHLEVAMFPEVRAPDQAFRPLGHCLQCVLSAWSGLALLDFCDCSHLG